MFQGGPEQSVRQDICLVATTLLPDGKPFPSSASRLSAWTFTDGVLSGSSCRGRVRVAAWNCVFWTCRCIFFVLLETEL